MMTTTTTKTTSEALKTPISVEALRQAVIQRLYNSVGKAIQSATKHDLYQALSLAIRDLLTERWRKTTEAHYAANPKFVYYLSAEYMLGKQLGQNLTYTGVTEVAAQVAAEFGASLEEFFELEPEPGLGNGGLGRLAACFMDSLATLDLPAVGYGIRYEFGIFRQTFVDGWQVEQPDTWLLHGNPWEFIHSDDMIEVGFGGYTEHMRDSSGRLRVRWIPGQKVLGEPCTMLVPGYGTNTVNILRLWRARAAEEFDFQMFDTGNYIQAVQQKIFSENISKVLYPNDGTPQGRELRLRQQYFFVACSLRDMIRRFRLRNQDWNAFPDKVAIQLNDTHPVIAIPELMRILVDEEGLKWEQAWDITQGTFAYTCHTLLPEALERWPVSLFEYLLPRHLEIIYEINHRFLAQVRARFPGDNARVARMSLIDENDGRQVRMANLASVGSFAINGVAELQSRLLREYTLADFGEMFPEKFQNKTNGVSPRRFLLLSNPRLCSLITEVIGEGWINDLERLRGLENYVDDPAFRQRWREIKQQNKADLIAFAQSSTGVMLDPAAMMDVMVKRLHEYKRQLLKLLHVVTLYQRLQDNPNLDLVPRTFLFGAKSASGYATAKLIIKLINSVAEVVNNDPVVRNRLKVVFPANFNVTMGQIIYPGAELSEQISLAGKEASGTGNMKFALNGALTIGTLDGANIEIRELVGPENFFLFGLNAEEVMALKASGYRPYEWYASNPSLKRAVDAIASGAFSRGDTSLFRPLVESLLSRDEYLVFADYQAYIDCQERVSQAYLDQEAWTRMSILNTARTGYFSSDRTIREYARDIWKLKPVRVE
ncbi:glycogen/starch/alpha-glucan phosphorylase [Caldilinea sp.]|jgi:starch phosphorylase|uniref:glycogen/starch/alpha-glucan phosphorylase n=1 Tax=Caldilinea sp. TaxID=2293560 RepID=UPI001B1F25E4|nr:glycogen/starch/alpha-glucan phosphorylase [Caldilinea sp.]MBO9394518.1 glycogen/starch/alpha-glucan phosphorylase [Caldilinea sp.]